MLRHNEIVKKCTEYVRGVFDEHQDKNLFYHNWEHTVHVRDAALEIAKSDSKVDEASIQCIELAAIFHDVAYFGGREGHEERGVAMARDFLKQFEYPADRLDLIEDLIMATQMGKVPTTYLEEILKDADLSHLGSSNYFENTYESLFKEINSSGAKHLTPENWSEMCLEFMSKHVYYTDYAKENWAAQKERNVEVLRNRFDAMDQSKPVEVKKKKGKKAGKDIPEKGIETMFRVSLRNHVNLSRIADNKANTLISVNAIIISIVLSTMFPKLDNNPHLIYPGLALLIFSITTIIISILSTIPKTTHGRLSREEVEARRGNLIFFGNFHSMSLDDYEWGINELMNDKDYLYKSLTRDLYFLGKVLNRKYKLLRYSYYIFVTGLILSIGLFALSVLKM